MHELCVHDRADDPFIDRAVFRTGERNAGDPQMEAEKTGEESIEEEQGYLANKINGSFECLLYLGVIFACLYVIYLVTNSSGSRLK